MKRMICLFLSFMMILLVVFTSSAFTLQGSDSYKSADASGAYVINFNGKHADIQRYTSQLDSFELNLSDSIHAVCAYNGKAVLFSNNFNDKQLIVYVYDLNTDVLDSFAIYGMNMYNSTDFCCNDNGIYIESSQDNHVITAYSYNGSSLGKYRFDGEITSIFAGYRSGIFAVAEDTLYTLSGNSFTEVLGTYTDPPLFHADSGVVASVYGKVYVLNGKQVMNTFSVDTDNHAASACVVGGRLYYPSGTTIYGYDIDSGKRVSYFKAPFAIRLVYDNANTITAVGDTSYTKFRISDFTEIQNPDDDDNGDKDGNGDTGTDNPSNPPTGGNHAALNISSDEYQIDWSNYHIIGIAPGTTVAEFKNNINYNGYELTIYKNKTKKKSGNVGTAMTAVFTYGDTSYTFELSVIGDITGEGSRNSRDLTVLMDYLIDTASFDGVYYIAADVSGDGVVDVVDVAILKSWI